jgi:hypothetical protein
MTYLESLEPDNRSLRQIKEDKTTDLHQTTRAIKAQMDAVGIELDALRDMLRTFFGNGVVDMTCSDLMKEAGRILKIRRDDLDA